MSRKILYWDCFKPNLSTILKQWKCHNSIVHKIIIILISVFPWLLKSCEITKMTVRFSRILLNVAKEYVFLSSTRINSHRAGRTIASILFTNVNKYSNTSHILKCWNCNYPHTSTLFCSKCKVLQELPEGLSYFNMMGVKEHYNVELQEVHDKYRELQKILHPDKFGNKSKVRINIFKLESFWWPWFYFHSSYRKNKRYLKKFLHR